MSIPKTSAPIIPSSSGSTQLKNKISETGNTEFGTTAVSLNLTPPSVMFRQQPEDLDVTRNNEATNEFQAKTIELRTQRPQWITYYQ